MSNRAERKRVASSTLEIINAGVYSLPDGKTIKIKSDIERCDMHTKVLDRNDWDVLFAKLASNDQSEDSHEMNFEKTKFEVTSEYSISCCRRLHQEGYENITCLNFASAKNPCGGMIGGALAQEESLGLCSALYSSLVKQDSHYKSNRQNPKDGLYQDSLIYSPGCVIFRDDADYALLEYPYKVNFISCPAVNRSVKRLDVSMVTDTMLRRAKAILAVAGDRGCDALVLGAWGTGVFQNDVKDIVSYFKEYLAPNQQESRMFENVFRTVVFAIGSDKQKHVEFKSAFSPT